MIEGIDAAARPRIHSEHDAPAIRYLERMRHLLRLAAALAAPVLLAIACSATGERPAESSGGGSTTGGGGAGGGAGACGTCLGDIYTPCNADGSPGESETCASGACAPGKGCVSCLPGS